MDSKLSNNVPLVKARRAVELAGRNAKAPLMRAERAATWTMEFILNEC